MPTRVIFHWSRSYIIPIVRVLIIELVGMEVNLDMQNALVPIYDCRFGPMKPLYENFECLSIHRYVKVLDKEVIYWSVISVLNYLDGKNIRHTSAVETLDYDPSENQDWNSEDYE